ncbi:MAG TPA: hypothetical protein VKT29_03855 [Terriglobales bacterium]|nr:hypothetical protein [Terriglobales bacterium]
MILTERKSMDCAGIYQQTKLKLDAQLKLGNKVDASAGMTQQVLANLTEATIALGQRRREFCEVYKTTPEMTGADYFRAVGAFNDGDSDIGLLFRYATGKAPQSELKDLKTVKPQENSSGAVDVSATTQDVLQKLDSVTARLTKDEAKLNALDPLNQNIATATATVEVTIASSDALDTHFADSGGYLAFVKGQAAVMVTASMDCFAKQQGNGRVKYHGVFQLDATSDVIGKPISILRNADYIQIAFRPMKPNQDVIAGRAIVIVNNSVRLEFDIPPQHMATSNLIFVRDLGPGLASLK